MRRSALLVCRKLPSEGSQTMMLQVVHGVLRTVQNPSRLGGAEADNEPKGDHLPLKGGQAFHGCHHFLAEKKLLRSSPRVPFKRNRRIHRFTVDWRRWAPCLIAPVISHAILRDTQQPDPEAVRIAQLAE